MLIILTILFYFIIWQLYIYILEKIGWSFIFVGWKYIFRSFSLCLSADEKRTKTAIRLELNMKILGVVVN